MVKQGLGLVQAQTQKLSPLQIQTIKLIELPVQDLEQRVRRELEENPVLDDTSTEGEDSKEVSLDDIQQDDYIPDYKTKVSNWGKDAKPEYNTFSVKESFFQNLYDQLSFRNLTEKDRNIATFIIGSLDEDGYLRRDLDSLVDDLAFRAGVECEKEDVERMLKVVQSLDPAGVGARDLRECLLLQLRAMKPTADVKLATDILNKDFDSFAGKHYAKIMQSRGISEQQMKAALKVILRLNPSPIRTKMLPSR